MAGARVRDRRRLHDRLDRLRGGHRRARSPTRPRSWSSRSATGSARSDSLFGNWGLLDVARRARVGAARDRRVRRRPGARHARRPVGGRGAASPTCSSPRPPTGLFTRAILHSPPLPEAANDPSAPRALGSGPRRRSHGARRGVVAATRRCCARANGRGTRGAALPTLDPAYAAGRAARRPGRTARHPGPRRHHARRGDVPAAHRRPRRARRARRARHRAASSPSRRERWARERAAAGGRCTSSAIDHASPDPRLGALHTIDVPLLFGTFRDSDGRAPLRRRRRGHARGLRVDAARLGPLPPRRRPRLAPDRPARHRLRHPKRGIAAAASRAQPRGQMPSARRIKLP